MKIMNWCDELAIKTKRSKTTIYRIANMLGRKPTVADILKRKPGRPKKY